MFKNSFSILENYTYYYDAFCFTEYKIKKYNELTEAMSECKKLDNCKTIVDYGCNGEFWTCSGDVERRSNAPGHCVWLKDSGITRNFELVKALKITQRAF